MVRIVNNCVGCPTCSPFCKKNREKVYFCDKCDDEADKLYWFDGNMLCISCIEKRLEEVERDGY